MVSAMTVSLQSVVPKTIPHRAAVIVFDFAPNGGRVQLVTTADGVETFALPRASVIRQLADRIDSFLDQQCLMHDGLHRPATVATNSQFLSLPDVMSDASCLFPAGLQHRLIGRRRLIIIPDEPLFDIPWLAVPCGSEILLDRFPEGISIAPSHSVLRPGQSALPAAPTSRRKPFHPVESSTLLLRPPANWSRMTIAGKARFDPLMPDGSSFELRDGQVTATDLDVRSTIRRGDTSPGTADCGPWSHLECVLSLNGVSARTRSLSGGERSGLMWSAMSRGAQGLIGTLWPIGESPQNAFLDELTRQPESRPLHTAVIQVVHTMRSRFAEDDTFAGNWAAISFLGT